MGGGGEGEGSLVTVDSKVRNSHLMFLHDLAYPEGEEETSEETKWAWSGLRKVNNNDVKYKKKKMKKKKQVVKAYNADDWEWKGTGASPGGFHNWPRKKKNSRPDQEWLNNNKKGKKLGCYEKGGCFQNQVKISQQSSSWEDSWAFEVHPFACDYRGKYILSNEPKTWLKAKKACEAAGLTLAMVRSTEEVKEMKQAIQFFLGEGDASWKTWDNRNWLWLGGNDLEEEGVWKWLNGEAVETWNVPWRIKAGKDNADFLKGSDGQHAIAFSRGGQFDDSYHDAKKRKRAFACQCPDS